MMLLFPPIGLAACALPAARSKAAAAAKIGNADFIGVTPCRKTVAQPRICASESVLGCGAWPLGRSGQVKRKAREVPRAFQASARHWAVSLTAGAASGRANAAARAVACAASLLVLGVLMPDAEVPVLGLAAVPELFRAMRHSGYRSVNRAAQEERHSSAAAGWSSQACPGLGQNSASAHRQAHQGLRRQRWRRLLSRPQPPLLQATRPRPREIRVS